MGKKFYEKQIGKKDLKKAKGFLAAFGVKVVYTKSINNAACRSGVVRIATDEVHLNEFWSAVFHELVHVLCYREGRYKLYHRSKPRGMTVKEYHDKVRKTALKAEQYVDKRAQRMMKEFFADVPYYTAYRDKEGKEWYRKWLDKHYPKKR